MLKSPQVCSDSVMETPEERRKEKRRQHRKKLVDASGRTG
jgi:hypothetical protein